MTTALRYGAAVGLSLAFFALNQAAAAVAGQPAPLIALLLAVIFASTFGGTGPGLLATGLGALLGWVFFLPPLGLFPMASIDVQRIAYFVVAGALTSWLVGSRHAALARWRDAASALRESETRARSVVDHVADGLVTIDERGGIVSTNPAAERLFGYSQEELAGRNVSMLMPEPYRNGHDAYIARYLASEPAKIIGTGREVVAKRRDGSVFPAELSVSEFRIGDRRYFTGVIRDLTDRKRAEQGLRESERQVRRVLDNLFAFVGILAPDGTLLDVNRAPLEVAGLSPGDVVGRRFWDCYWWSYSPDVQADLRASVDRAARGDMLRYDVRVRTAGGSRMWIDFQLAPLRDEDGHITHVIASAVDLTPRKQAEEALQRAHALLEGITQGTEDLIAATDGEYRYLYFNAAYEREFERLWGREPEIGQRIIDALDQWPEERRKAEALWRRALEGETFRITTEFGPSEAASQVYDLRFNPVYDREGRLIGAAHILRNVTDWVRLRESLRRSEASLREENRRKNEFLAVLGHELRNPLAPLRTGLDLLESQEQPEQLARVRTIMDRQVTHLTRLVDDLLDLARISRGKILLRRGRLDLNDAIDAALDLARPRIDARRHRLIDERGRVPMPVYGDFQRLTQVFANLLHNAAKYTPPGGNIRLLAETLQGAAVVRFADTGFGIPPEQLDEVFEMFSQVPEHRATTGGGDLGIGLALARHLVRLHGGSLEAESEGLGFGSEFIVRLPLQQSDPSRESAAGTPDEAEVRRRILVVDDNEDAATSLTMLLEAKGHSVHTVYDGPSALEAVSCFGPDVVLLDLGLPGMDGHEVARRIRALPRGGEIVLFAITGWGQQEDRLHSRDAGFDEHLTKPVDAALLSALISAESPNGAVG